MTLSKVKSKSQNLYSKQEIPIVRCLAHGMQYLHFVFGLSQSFSDNSNLIILLDSQRLRKNGKYFYRGLYFV